LPHLGQILVKNLLLVGSQHGANVIQLVAEQAPNWMTFAPC